MKRIVVCFLSSFLIINAASALDLKQAKFTQVINDVKVVSGDQISPATVDDFFKMPDVLRTGEASRAELVAADDTITRVGANTIFSFDPAERTIDLQQGSLLFHSPHGKGGGTIRTAVAVASVIGTTLIVSTTPNGGFKVLDLEGQVDIRYLDGTKQSLQPGQMVFVLPHGGGLSPIIVFRLDLETTTSALVQGFRTPLSSMPLINEQIVTQLKLIRNGLAQDTRLLVGSVASQNQVQVVVDPTTVQTAVGDLNTVVTGASTVQQALAEDATITSSLLSVIRPNRIFFTDYDITDNPFLAALNPFDGFFGNNITINTPTVDLSPYAGDLQVDLVAHGTLDLAGSVTFTGLNVSDYLYLVAGNQLTIAPGSTVQADSGEVLLGSESAMTLNDVSLANNTGGVSIDSLGAVSLLSGSSVNAAGLVKIGEGLAGSIDVPGVDIDTSSIHAGSLNVQAINTATLNDTTLISSSGVIEISTEHSTVDIEQSTINSSGDLDLSSGGSLTLGLTLNDTISAGGSGANAVKIDAVGQLTDDSTPITETGGGDIDFDSSAGSVSVENCNLSTSCNVNLTSFGGITLGYFNGTYAAPQTFTGDDITIQAGFGPVDLWTTSLNASGNINVSSDLSVILQTDSGLGETADTFTAGNDLTLTSAGGDVDVYDGTGLTATAGNVTLTATIGNIDIENSSLAGGKGVGAFSPGTSSTITIGTSTLEGHTTGVSVEAGGDVTLTTATIIADAANAGVISDHGALSITGGSVSAAAVAGATVTLSGATGATVSGATVTTDPANGTVNLSSPGGQIMVESGASLQGNDLTLNANGDISVMSGSSISGGNSIELENDAAASADTTVNDANLTSSAGVVDIYGNNTITLQDSTIDGEGIVGAAGTLDVDISTFGAVTINDCTLTAGLNDLYVACDGNLTVNNSSQLEALNGSLSLLAQGTFDADTVDLEGLGVALEEQGAATINDSTITSDGAGIDLESQTSGDVTVEGNSTLNANTSLQVYSDFGNVDLESSTLTGGTTVDIVAGNSDSSGAETLTVNADTVTGASSLSLGAPGNITVTSGNLGCTAGNVSITSGNGSIDLESPAIRAVDSSGATVTLTGATGVTVSGATITTDAAKGTVDMTSSGGSITINNGATIQTGVLTLNADGGILLDGSATPLSITGSGVSSAVNLTTAGTLTLNTVDLSSYASINLNAHTIDLQNITFLVGVPVRLNSFSGLPNFGSAVPGDVNFISNVHYGANSLVGTILGVGQILLGSTSITLGTSGL